MQVNIILLTTVGQKIVDRIGLLWCFAYESFLVTSGLALFSIIQIYRLSLRINKESYKLAAERKALVEHVRALKALF